MSFERTVTSRGKKYRQLVESRWDPARKQSRIHVIRHLGAVIEEGGVERVVPARLRVDSFESSRSVGGLALWYRLCEEFRLRKCVTDALGDEEAGGAVLALVLNQLVGRRSLDEVGPWLSSSSIARWSGLDPAEWTKDALLGTLDRLCTVNEEGRFSQCLAVQRNATGAWRDVVGRDRSRSYYYHDVTRIRYNGTTCPLAERGYGAVPTRPHVGFALLTARAHQFPLLGFPVRGSHPDATTVPTTLAALRAWDLPPTTIVWDRGMLSRPNMKMARDAGFHVLTGVPERGNEAIHALTQWRDADIEQRENTLRRQKTGGVYVKAWDATFLGQKGRFAVVLDPQKRTRERLQRDLLIEEIQQATSKARITQLREALGKLITPSPGRRGWRINAAREAAERTKDGRTLFFTTDRDLEGRDIVKAYYQRDEVEKAFRTLRGETSLAPIGYRKPGRVEAYLSVINYLAYLLRAGAAWKIRENELGVSVDELIAHLEEIHEVVVLSGKERIARWTHVSEDARRLMKPFGIERLGHSD